jgi:hypothetical protein
LVFTSAFQNKKSQKVLVANAHSHVQTLVSVVKMVAVLEYATKEQRSVVHVLWAKGLNGKDIRIEMLPVYGGKFLSGNCHLVADVSLLMKGLKRRCGSG